jgi:hypothetical protein
MESTTYTIRADPGFEAVYELSPCDLQIPQRAIRQGFVYSTEKEFSHDESKAQRLVNSLQESLKTLLEPVGNSSTRSLQLLGSFIRQPGDGSPPHVAVDKSSSIPLKVVHTLDIDSTKSETSFSIHGSISTQPRGDGDWCGQILCNEVPDRFSDYADIKWRS